MRPQLLKVSKRSAIPSAFGRTSFLISTTAWHYHQEVELIHFNKGEGTQFVGDSIRNFKSGDVVLVGAGLPHYWRFNDFYFDENKQTPVDIRVCHFCENFWGEQFLQLPENIKIKNVLEKAKRGLQITGKTRTVVAEFLDVLLHTEGPHRIMLLTQALTAIAECRAGSIPFIHRL